MKRIRIRGPMKPGTKILKDIVPGAGRRWLNPEGEDFEVEVALTPWIQAVIARGDVETAPEQKPAKRQPPPKVPKYQEVDE